LREGENRTGTDRSCLTRRAGPWYMYTGPRQVTKVHDLTYLIGQDLKCIRTGQSGEETIRADFERTDLER
jgi:hypothetical protein